MSEVRLLICDVCGDIESYGDEEVDAFDSDVPDEDRSYGKHWIQHHTAFDYVATFCNQECRDDWDNEMERRSIAGSFPGWESQLAEISPGWRVADELATLIREHALRYEEE